MEIKITRNANSILLDQGKALWKFRQDNKPWTSTAFPILSLFVGTITVLIYFVTYKIGESFWKPQSILGIALILLSILIYLSKYISKKNLIASINKAIEEYEKHSNVTEIILTDSLIRLKDFQTNHELKWSAFKNINISKDHFFFMMDKHFKNGFVITKNELAETDVQQLTNFIRNKKRS